MPCSFCFLGGCGFFAGSFFAGSFFAGSFFAGSFFAGSFVTELGFKIPGEAAAAIAPAILLLGAILSLQLY